MTMKKALLFIAFAAYFLPAAAQVIAEGTQFTEAQIAKASTAAGARSISQMDKDIITLCNLARLDGAKFWNSFVAPYLDGDNDYYVTSLESDLAAISNLQMLKFEPALQRAAEHHANDMSSTGITGHQSSDGTSFVDRVRSYYNAGRLGENCSYGSPTALEVVTDLLIDEGVESLGHRKNILNPDFSAVGACTRPHMTWRYCTVIDFGKPLIAR